MTDAEAEQAAELVVAFNRARGVVAERGVGFIRIPGMKLACLHEGSVSGEGTIEHVGNGPQGDPGPS